MMSKYPDDMGRIMHPDEQLRLWVDGKPVHNGATRKDGECCPDFSCCYPHLMAPEKVRKAFAQADIRVREKMLFMFICGLTADVDLAIHVVSDDPTNTH